MNKPDWYQCSMEGLGVLDAARLMGCSPATAGKELRRAKSALSRGTVSVAGAAGDVSLQAYALFLQSNWPTREPRQKTNLERAFA